MDNKLKLDDFICEFCHSSQDTLYEGWFKNIQAFNPFAKGTVSASLMQLRRACYDCVKEAIKNGWCKAEIPNDYEEDSDQS